MSKGNTDGLRMNKIRAIGGKSNKTPVIKKSGSTLGVNTGGAAKPQKKTL